MIKTGCTCSFCLFKLGFNYVMWSASFSFNLKHEDIESIMLKQFSSHKFLQAGFSNKCWKIWDFLSVTKCSLILVGKWRLVSPNKQTFIQVRISVHLVNSLYSKKNFQFWMERKRFLCWIFHRITYINFWFSSWCC